MIVSVTGWGVTEQGKPADELRRLELPYKPQDLCAKELPPTWDNKYNLIDKICAGLYNQNMSVCKGDSGGGLFYQNEVDGRFYLHGVVSLGVGNKGECDFRYNTLYTSVAFHYDFVYSTYVTYTEDCKLPAQPTNGKWTIEGQDKKPGDRVSADTVLTITCEKGFRLYPNISTIACASASLIPKCLKITCKDGNPYPRLTCMYDGQEGAYLTDFSSFALLCSRIIYNRIELNQDGQLRTSADYNVDHALTSLIRPVTDTILITVYGSSKREVDEFSIVAANQTARKTFIDSVMAFVEKYNLYGANIHWDSPQVKDRVNYGILIKEMKERFKLFTRWKLFLSATVNHSPENLGYNHIEMYNNLDWINVECYDRPDSEGDSSRSYFESCAENWLSYSYKDKLSLGIGAFGRYFTFKNPDEHEPNAPPVAGSLDSKRTERIPYIKILKEYTNWTKAWDDKEKHPYVYNGNDWIGYDDINSTELKAKYITDNNYFGATVYPVNWDPSFSTNTLSRVVSHHFDAVFKDWLRIDDKCRPLVI
ncbi:hypothetical protein NQ318_016916 [Aromia moschata]|uniref:GH18 domain-containing protein n=1 Tax=Aromia moschata TaxID=1265417 RepID=A0AAV8XHX4_9CUCU|nr:hypothetical protein NQ318_016916 [Aromia moschata]